jgi:hypothetical protein
MTDHIKKYREISLLDSMNQEEIIRYELEYEVVLYLGMPTSLNLIKAVRTEFRYDKDLITEVSEEELPYFMWQNVIDKEISEVA